MSTILDSYSEANYTATSTTSYTSITPEGRSQSFTADYSYNVTKARFYLRRDAGDTTQIVRAYLYAHSGTYGSSSVPGSLLATSDAVNLSDIGTSVSWIEFTFSTPYLVTQGTNYVIAVMCTQGTEELALRIGYDGTTLAHDGNYASNSSGSWSASTSREVIFEVLGDLASITVTTPLINCNVTALAPTVKYNERIIAPLINCNVTALTPTVKINMKVDVPLINCNVTALVPTVTHNIRISVPLINCNVQALTPTVKHNIIINAPLINCNVTALAPTVTLKEDITINVPLIEITCEALTPRIRIIYPANFIVSAGNYFTKNRYEKFEFELLSLNNERYENAGWVTDYVIKDSASITMDFSRDVIGSVSFNIRNNTNINYLVDLIRPWYVLNDTYRFPLGTFMLSSPKKKSDAKLVTRPIQGYDLLLALEQDKMINSVTYEAGESVIDIIENTLLYSYETLWVNADIEPSDEVLATDVSYELGKSKLFIINSLLNMINYYPLWVDGNGVFRSIPWNKETNKCYEFIDDNLSIYAPGIELNLDYTNMYNRVVIINNQLAQDTEPLYKVWTFENEGLGSHPLSYSSLGRYITKIFQSDAVSQDYVDLRARRELLKMLEIEESVDYKHMFISARENDGLPWQGDSYRFKNTKLDVDSIYKLESMTYNLKTGGLVNSKIKRIRSTY
jgi:hypothetical protein